MSIQFEHERMVRRRDFPDTILKLGYTSPVVQAIIDSYVYEKIITMEEALCQMVVELSTASDVYRDEVLKLHMNSCFPVPKS